MNRVFLDLGFIEIYWYSVFILIGILVGSLLIFTEAKKKKLNLEFVTNLIFFGIVFALIGARLYYCLFNYDYYSKYPLEILEVWNGGLAIHGAIIFGGLYILFYCLKYKVKFLKVADILVPGLMIGQAIGRWGNFFNQEAYGMEVTREVLQNNLTPNFIIDGMNINGTYYEPMFLYESIWNIYGFIVLLLFRRFIKNLKVGQLTALYLMWYSLGRYFIEAHRSDSLMYGNYKVAQIVSIVLFIIGLIIFIIALIKPKFQDRYEEDFADMKF